MNRAYYDMMPSNTEAVGNGDYFFRWDIQEEIIERDPEMGDITQYSCYEVTVSGEPTYDKCVRAIIRANYSEDQELAMINKFNSYNNGIIEDNTIIEEYKNYLSFVAQTKEQVKSILTKSFVL